MALKDKFFNISETANYLDVTRQTIARWISEGKLFGEKVGGTVLIDRDEVYKYDNDRAMENISQSIIRLTVNRLRDELRLNKDDIVQCIGSDENGTFNFSVNRVGGTNQIAHVRMCLVEFGIRKNRWEIIFHKQNFQIEDIGKNKDMGNK